MWILAISFLFLVYDNRTNQVLFLQIRVDTDRLSRTFFSRPQLQTARVMLAAVLEKLRHPWATDIDRMHAHAAWNSAHKPRRSTRTTSGTLCFNPSAAAFSRLLSCFAP